MKKIKFNFKDAPWSLIRKKFSFLLNNVIASAKCLNHQNIHLQTSLTKKLFQDVRTQCEKLLEATPFSLLPNPSFCTFLHSTWEEVPRKYKLPTSNMNNICTLWMSSCMKQIFLKTTSIINPFAKFHVNPKQIVLSVVSVAEMEEHKWTAAMIKRFISDSKSINMNHSGCSS